MAAPQEIKFLADDECVKVLGAIGSDMVLKMARQANSEVDQMFKKLMDDYGAHSELMKGLAVVASKFRPANLKMLVAVTTQKDSAADLKDDMTTLMDGLDSKDAALVKYALETALKRALSVKKPLDEAKRGYETIAQEISMFTSKAKELADASSWNKKAAGIVGVTGGAAGVGGGVGVGAGVAALCIMTGPPGWAVGLSASAIVIGGGVLVVGAAATLGGGYTAISEHTLQTNANMIHSTMTKVNKVCGEQMITLVSIERSSQAIIDKLDNVVTKLMEIYNGSDVQKRTLNRKLGMIMEQCDKCVNACDEFITNDKKARSVFATSLGLED